VHNLCEAHKHVNAHRIAQYGIPRFDGDQR
jgi:hypothetical protein